MSATGRVWVYASRPAGEVTQEHYELKEIAIPTEEQLEEGEILIKTLYCSVDPYMRIQQAASNTWEAPHPLGEVQGGGTVGRVLLSKYADLHPGDIIVAYTGWREYAKLSGASARKLDPDQAPISYSLGILGMPGRTAYFGFLEAGKPKAGETVVVSGAAGAVGSIVVQIAKISGCKVVAIAGDEEKLKALKDLGADEIVNYKLYPTQAEIQGALAQACPNGIDIYFDNVGGIITDAVMNLINVRARVIICGQISQYNGALDKPELGPRFLHNILYKRATIQGILARDFNDRMPEMLQQMSAWLKEGKIKYHETIVDGFEQLPAALNMLFHGKNNGKLLVKLAD